MTQPTTNVGSAGISITPELDRAGLAAFRAQLRAATSSAARAATSSLKQQFGTLPQLGDISGQMQAQRVKAQQELRRTTRIYQGEADAWKSLQRQKTSALAESTRRQKQHMTDLSRHFDTRLLQMKTAFRDGDISQREYARGTADVMSAARSAGLSIDDLARKKASLARLTKTSFLESMYAAGTALSQIGTRVGMLGYQMQLLGRMITTYVTAPVGLALGGAVALGIKQAATIESAVKGIKALNPEKNIIPVMERMISLAEKSPVFEVGPLLQGIQGLVANGIGLERAAEVMEAMGNIGLTVGSDPQRMSRALYAFTQVASKGKLMTEEFRQQIAEAIPGMSAILAEGLGVPLKDVAGLLESGKISAEEFFDAVVKAGTSGKYLKGAQEGSTSLAASWSSLKESVMNTLARPFLTDQLQVKPEIIEGLNRLGVSLKKLIESATDAGVFDSMISNFTKFVGILEKGVDRFSELSDTQKKSRLSMVGFAAVIGPAMMAVAPFFTAIASAIGAMGTLGITIGSIANPAGAAAVAVLGLTAILGGSFIIAFKKVEAFRKAFIKGFWEAVALFDKWVMPSINAVWQEIVNLGRSFESMGLTWDRVGGGMAFTLKSVVGLWTVLFRLVQGGLFVFRKGLDVLFTTLAVFPKFLQGLLNAAEAMFKLLNKIPGVQGRYDSALEFIRGSRDSMKGLSDSLLNFGKGTGDATGTTFSLVGALGALGGALDTDKRKAQETAAAIDNLRQKMKVGREEVTNAKQADERWTQARRNLEAALVRGGITLDKHTAAGKANTIAVREAVKASYDKMLMDVKSGVPMDQAIRRHKERTDRIKAEVGKTADLKNQVEGLVVKYGRVPKNVRTLMTLLGFKDVNQRMLDLYVRQRALKEGSTISAETARVKKLMGDSYATGGWTGPGSKFQPAGVVHADEYVVKKESRKRFEQMHPRVLDHINRTGMLPPQYANGGQVWPFPVNVKGTKIDKSWAVPSFVSSGGSAGGPGQYQAMYRWIASRVPGTRLTSGYRPGDPGYHGQGRATDLTFSDGSERRGGGLALKAFNLIKGTFMKSIKELIWDFAKGNAVWNGRNHFFTGASAGPGTHNDHIHWAHDNGGPVPPGVGSNYSNKTELMLNNAQAHALEDRIRGDDGIESVNIYLDGELVRGVARAEIKKANGQVINALSRGRSK